MLQYIRNLISHNRITVFLMGCMALGLISMRMMFSEELAHKFVIFGRVWDFFFSMGVFLFILLSHRLFHRWLNKVYPYERNVTIRLAIQICFSLIFVFSLRTLVVMGIDYYTEFRIPVEFRSFIIVADIMFLGLLNAVFIGDYFLERWKTSTLEKEMLEKANIHSQFEALKNQVNPHFLFNSFTVLNELIYEDREKASRYLEQLSVVYRYILKNNDVDAVSIREELNFLNAYLYLLEIRYGTQLEVEVDVKPSDLEKNIPPITLQILVENAIKHNVISADQPLKITIRGNDGKLSVINNIQLKSNRQIGSRLGLSNIRRRYKLLDNKQVHVDESLDVFSVHLPMLQS